MAEESFEEKTQEATPRRRKDAAEKGQVARSQEVTTAFLLLAGGAVISTGGGPLVSAVVDLFTGSVASFTAPAVGPEAAAGFVTSAVSTALAGVVPVLLILSGTALAVSAVQARGVLTLEPLKPQWERLDPIKKAQQIWGMQAIAELVKSFLRMAVIGLAVWIATRPLLGELPVLLDGAPYGLVDVVRRYVGRIFLFSGLAYLVLAGLDYGYQLWQHERRLRMTREEVKKEMKDAEGDQVVKIRRRTMARQLAHRRMMLSVSEADVVVTNPTHIAVALQYDPETAHAPIVLAMGERLVAQRIKEIARESDVPLVENKPLARALFATGKVGWPIPVELFVAVAEVLAFVYRMRSGAGYRPGRRSRR